jgi:rubrerythrin
MFHDAEEALTYLSRVADSFVFDRTADPLAPFAGVHSAADLFDVVIAMERKSIELYEAMLKVVRREQEAALVRAIIAEEEKHVADLVNAKAGA